MRKYWDIVLRFKFSQMKLWSCSVLYKWWKVLVHQKKKLGHMNVRKEPEELRSFDIIKFENRGKRIFWFRQRYSPRANYICQRSCICAKFWPLLFTTLQGKVWMVSFYFFIFFCKRKIVFHRCTNDSTEIILKLDFSFYAKFKLFFTRIEWKEKGNPTKNNFVRRAVGYITYYLPSK